MTERSSGFDREDGSCLDCDGHATKRVGRYGEFYSCSNYPQCRNTMSFRQPRRSEVNWLLSQDDIDRAYYDAFYDGDGR